MFDRSSFNQGIGQHAFTKEFHTKSIRQLTMVCRERYTLESVAVCTYTIHQCDESYPTAHYDTICIAFIQLINYLYSASFKVVSFLKYNFYSILAHHFFFREGSMTLTFDRSCFRCVFSEASGWCKLPGAKLRGETIVSNLVPETTSLKWMKRDFQPFPMQRIGIIQLKQPLINGCLRFQEYLNCLID